MNDFNEISNTEQVNTEEKARSMGWVPQDEFRGDKERWVTAEKFIEIGENKMPVMRERNERLHEQLSEVKRSVSEIKQMYAERLEKETKEAYNRAIKDLKDQQRKAVESGDAEEYDRIEREISAVPTPEPPQVNAHQPHAIDPDVEAWLKDNRWFTKDQEMSAYARSVESYLLAAKPGMTQQDILQEVTRRTRAEFPEKFGNPNRQKPNNVHAGSDAPPVTKGKRTFADLPEDAKKKCTQYVKDKLMSKEEYLELYDWS